MKEFLTETVQSKFVLVESAEKESGVLAVVKGTFAEYDKPNANSRVYSEKLWDLVLQNPEVIKALEGKRLYGELDHPEDHMDIVMEKAAFAITELRKNTTKKVIEGTYKILDTPAGRILNTLIRFGSVLGVSSRGSGELTSGMNGMSEVIPESYEFVTFDVVSNPSNRGAIPSLVESVDKNNNFKAILESIKDASEKELKLIEEMSSNYSDEMATEIINKVEERRLVLESEDETETEEVQEPSKEDIIIQKLDVIIDLLSKIVSAPSVSTEPETPAEQPDEVPAEEVTENTQYVRAGVAVKPRVRYMKESIDTQVVAAVIPGAEDEQEETTTRVGTLVKIGKSK